MTYWEYNYTIIIELNKLEDVLEKPVEEMTSLDMWSAFLGYADDPKYRKLINEVLEKKEAISVAGTVLAEISKDEHERAKLLSRRKYETDMMNNMLVYEERGMKEGMRKGIREVALKLKKEAIIPIEKIAQLSGLSIDEISEL